MREPQAQQAEKNLTTEIADGVSMKAQEGQIKQLAALLIDNAIKYCDDKGTIHAAWNNGVIHFICKPSG